MTRVVDQSTFAAIECNRCGNCCEALYLHTRGKHSVHEGPLGFLENYGRYIATRSDEWCRECDPGMYASADTEHRHGLDDMLFFGQLEAWLDETGQYRARCGHFERDAAGLGVCSFYERRPYMCSAFPYGHGQPGYAGCSWDVEIVDFEVVQ